MQSIALLLSLAGAASAQIVNGVSMVPISAASTTAAYDSSSAAATAAYDSSAASSSANGYYGSASSSAQAYSAAATGYSAASTTSAAPASYTTPPPFDVDGYVVFVVYVGRLFEYELWVWVFESVGWVVYIYVLGA